MLKFDVITILPNFFDSFLKESLIKRALDNKLIKINIHNLRKYTKGKHKIVDDTPYGGGPGMIIKIEPIFKNLQFIRSKIKSKKVKTIFLSPRGKKFSQDVAKKWAKLDNLIIVSGRYEGVDERAKDLCDEIVSTGDFITLGGEVSSMAMIEAVARLVPGVVGKRNSIEKLDFPQYTRPEQIMVKTQNGKQKKLSVPKVLLSGDHKKIQEWRDEHSVKIQ